MFESTLATTDDANLILKLYELRTEEVMRQARRWMLGEFNPGTAEEFFAVSDSTAGLGEHNAWFRQVSSYWEMAAAFVIHGALNADLFVDCNPEPFFLYAKFLPLLPEIRKKHPGFFKKVGLVVEQCPAAQERVTQLSVIAARRAAAAKAK